MCLYTTQNVPTIAEKDITCYKVICKDMSSLYHNDFKWEFGRMYYSWIEVVGLNKDCNFKEIHQAFHSYETLEDLKKAYFNATSPCLTVKCTIPKGSTVYRGKHDDLKKGYASNQLIINEVINIKELFLDFPWNEYPYKPGQTIRVDWLNGQVDILQIENIQPNSVRGEYTGASLICEWGYKYQTDMTGKNPHDNYIIELVE